MSDWFQGVTFFFFFASVSSIYSGLRSKKFHKSGLLSNFHIFQVSEILYKNWFYQNTVKTWAFLFPILSVIYSVILLKLWRIFFFSTFFLASHWRLSREIHWSSSQNWKVFSRVTDFMRTVSKQYKVFMTLKPIRISNFIYVDYISWNKQSWDQSSPWMEANRKL